MSKLAGKRFLEKEQQSKEKDGNGLKREEFTDFGLYIRYLKTLDSYEFKGLRMSKEIADRDLKESGVDGGLEEVGENRGRYRLVVRADVLGAMILADKVDSIIYSWSAGYKVREKKTNLDEIVAVEVPYITSMVSVDEGGRGIGGKYVMPFDDYQDVCVWQCLFGVSYSICVTAKRAWRSGHRGLRGGDDAGWIQVPVLSINWGGKRAGANLGAARKRKYVDTSAELERVRHNKKVAILKRSYGWYVEACKEECKLLGLRFDKEKCLKSWDSVS